MIEAFFDFGREFPRDDLFVTRFPELLAHIDDLYLGKRSLFYAIGQFDERIFIFLSVKV